jgi:predicted nucleic acid-binding protein
MNPRIYVETSVVSYLAARPSRDAITSARQIATHLWWRFLGESFDGIMSDLVLREARRGDESAAARRIAFCAALTLIDTPENTASLAQRLMDERIVPSTEPEDAAHIAIATLAGAKYLATWNFTHFASPDAKYRVVIALSQWGYTPPLIVTPEELLEEQPR